MTTVDWTLAPAARDFPRIRLEADNSYHCRMISPPLHFQRALISRDGQRRWEPILPDVAKRYGIQSTNRWAFCVLDRSDYIAKVIEVPTTIFNAITEAKWGIEKKRRYHGRKTEFVPWGRWGAELTIKVSGFGIDRRYETQVRQTFLRKTEMARIKDVPDLKGLYRL